MAYARSSAKLLTKLVLEDHDDSYRWEVSSIAFLKFHLCVFINFRYLNVFVGYTYNMTFHL